MSTETVKSAGAEAVTSAGLLFLLETLGDPTKAESDLTDRVTPVDLSSQSGTKWEGVAKFMANYLGDLVPTAPVAGGGGMATTSSSNQWTNRMERNRGSPT